MKLKLNIIDAAIVILIILAAVFAFTRTGPSVQSFTFDGTDISRAVRKYLELDQQGYVLNGKISGTNLDGKSVNVEGVVKWASGGQLILEAGGETVSVGGPAGRYEDVFARSIILEVSHRIRVENIILEPKKITTLLDLIPEGKLDKTFRIYTQIALVDASDMVKFQGVVNGLRAEKKYVSVYPLALRNNLSIDGASLEDLKTASRILGSIEGLSDSIIMRVYYPGERLN
ncbi:MAG: hypothetical protein KGZ79_07430 [Dethiobacter sp.]|jgi:hypothetical protein|nr:hypothetical protein [Dethiobacter sp.]